MLDALTCRCKCAQKKLQTQICSEKRCRHRIMQMRRAQCHKKSCRFNADSLTKKACADTKWFADTKCADTQIDVCVHKMCRYTNRCTKQHYFSTNSYANALSVTKKSCRYNVDALTKKMCADTKLNDDLKNRKMMLRLLIGGESRRSGDCIESTAVESVTGRSLVAALRRRGR